MLNNQGKSILFSPPDVSEEEIKNFDERIKKEGFNQ